MRNSDPIIHNVRSLSQENRPFNIAQPAGTPDRLKRFSDQEGPIELRCDYHRWMRAFIFVMEHPFFGVTDAQGRFSIKNLPSGEYVLATWHESFGENKQTSKLEQRIEERKLHVQTQKRFKLRMKRGISKTKGASSFVGVKLRELKAYSKKMLHCS